VTNLEVPGDSYMKNIKNLRENATYVFSVSATNSIGQGQGIVKSLTLGPQPGNFYTMHISNYSFLLTLLDAILFLTIGTAIHM
jgi:hypothetical protein